MDILTARKGASLAALEQQSNRMTSPRGGVMVVVVVVVYLHQNTIQKWVCGAAGGGHQETGETLARPDIFDNTKSD